MIYLKGTQPAELHVVEEFLQSPIQRNTLGPPCSSGLTVVPYTGSMPCAFVTKSDDLIHFGHCVSKGEVFVILGFSAPLQRYVEDEWLLAEPLPSDEHCVLVFRDADGDDGPVGGERRDLGV